MWRIVIQDSRSLRYLNSSGSWDYEAKSARGFGRITDAAEFCAGTGLKEVHIVVGTVRSDGRFDASSKTIMRVPRVRQGARLEEEKDSQPE